MVKVSVMDSISIIVSNWASLVLWSNTGYPCNRCCHIQH